MKKVLLILALILLLGFLAGCSVSFSPELYGPPYYTGPAYPTYVYPAPVMVAPAPIIVWPEPMGPIIVVPRLHSYYLWRYPYPRSPYYYPYTYYSHYSHYSHRHRRHR